jgi:hypothetical protein
VTAPSRDSQAPRTTAPLRTKKISAASGDDEESASAIPQGSLNLPSVREHWGQMLTRLRQKNKSTEALLKDAQPIAVEGNLITIGFFYELHKERVEKDKNAKGQIEKIFTEMFGAPCRIKCIISPKKQKIKAAQDDPMIRAAMNMGAVIKPIDEE